MRRTFGRHPAFASPKREESIQRRYPGAGFGRRRPHAGLIRPEQPFDNGAGGDSTHQREVRKISVDGAGTPLSKRLSNSVSSGEGATFLLRSLVAHAIASSLLVG